MAILDFDRRKVTVVLLVACLMMGLALIFVIGENTDGAEEYCNSQNKEFRIGWGRYYCDDIEIRDTLVWGWMPVNRSIPRIEIPNYSFNLNTTERG